MGKKEQILVLEPASELHFVGPFTDVVTSTLKLTNPSDSPVMFKVKTTAPKKYCVRPNSGILAPDQVLNIAVMLQPFDYNPNEKNKHKFMVQTIAIKSIPDQAPMLEELWREAQPDSLMDSKLRCVFYLPGEKPVQNNNLDASEVSGDDKSIVNKIVAEPVLKSFSKATHVDPEIKKCADENKRLKEEIKNLMQENSQLKAEGLRLRSRGANLTSDASTSSSHPTKQPFESSQLQEQPQSPMLYLAVMLTIGLLGIFLGKFVV